MTEREQKALIIAAKSRIIKKGDTWLVPSQSSSKLYRIDSDLQRCTCPDYETRQDKCKHILAVEYTIEREHSAIETADGEVDITTTVESVRVTKRVYKQDWPAYNAAQTNEKRLFQSLLHDLCQTIQESKQTRGRPRLPISDMLFSAVFKVYSTISGRRFMTDLREAHIKGYISELPSYNSIFNYLEMAELTPVLQTLIRLSSMPLSAIETDFAVDSSGFSTCRFVRWYNAKYGKEVDNHDWIKVHLMCGVKTNIVTSVEISGRHANDFPYFIPMVNDTSRRFTISEVSGDKAYAGNDNFEAVEKLGGTAFIPFKTNATGEGSDVWKKMYHYYSFRRDEFLAHYHKRSNSESTFSMIKAKFGDSLRCKTDRAIINEALCKILAHNICCVIQSMFEFGIQPTFC
jgi:transposase